MVMIRKSVEADLPVMLAIINDAAQAYRGVIPALLDCFRFRVRYRQEAAP
jgi:hypothetical protein